jgi:hypothetical protein
MKLGSAFGTLLPPWQVKHVTRGAPPKNCLLMRLHHRDHLPRALNRGVCVANADLSSAALEAWQKVQSLPIELANVPITSKKVSTGNAAQQLHGLEDFLHVRDPFGGRLCRHAGRRHQTRHADDRGVCKHPPRSDCHR